MSAVETKEQVRSFWSRTPCGSRDATAPESTAEYFAQIEARRYELEPFIRRFAAFRSTRGQSVLEIGVGLGTDHVQFARAGARLHGIDLTQRGVELVGRRLVRVYAPGQLRRMMREAGFAGVETRVGVFNTSDTALSYILARRTRLLDRPRVLDWLGRIGGWYVLGIGRTR